MPPSTQHTKPNNSEGLLAQNEEAEPGKQRRGSTRACGWGCREEGKQNKCWREKGMEGKQVEKRDREVRYLRCERKGREIC